MKAVVLSIAGGIASALTLPSFAMDRVDSGEAIISENNQSIRIQSEAQPNHITGRFPNSGNPHAIERVQVDVQVAANPVKTNRATAVRMAGVALNGILFEPGTAECFGQSRRSGGSQSKPSKHQHGKGKPHRHGSRPTGPAGCEWSEEAQLDGKTRLGLDQNQAHVQPGGLYHYHGIPEGLIDTAENTGDLVWVGYAADGHRLLYSRSGQFNSSYRLKSGQRSSGPGGTHTGLYTQDWSYQADAGDLDACNGITIDGEYVYLMTEDFPYLPRCVYGTIDASFNKRG